mmetsp:Transcript_13692/g.20091  ORF Transcript_13692/g.20091 Transcript_13692/m.20091 type:complete len:139 (-) Transcript_13692:743-1159(-)
MAQDCSNGFLSLPLPSSISHSIIPQNHHNSNRNERKRKRFFALFLIMSCSRSCCRAFTTIHNYSGHSKSTSSKLSILQTRKYTTRRNKMTLPFLNTKIKAQERCQRISLYSTSPSNKNNSTRTFSLVHNHNTQCGYHH